MESLAPYLAPLITAIIAWLAAKARGDKQRKLSDLLWAGLKQEVQRLLADPGAAEVARSKLTRSAWLLLERVGAVKLGDRPGWADVMVSAAVEHGMAEIEEWLGVQRVIEAKWRADMDRVIERLEGAVKVLSTPPAVGAPTSEGG